MFWKNRINRLLSYDASLDVVKLTGGWFANSAEPRFKLPTEARFVSPMYKETGEGTFCGRYTQARQTHRAGAKTDKRSGTARESPSHFHRCITRKQLTTHR